MTLNKRSSWLDLGLSLSLLSLLSLAVAACSKSNENDVDEDPTCAVTVAPGEDDQTALQGAMIEAEPGDTICLKVGTYKLTGQLSLATERVTVRGQTGTILDFSEQTSGANGIELSADHDTLERLQVQNPKGDGVRATNVDYPTFRELTVVWTNGSSSRNGGYGIYPVTSSHVLIEKCHVTGASDAGIYVGQSHDIIVRDSEADGNVAGFEIENSIDAEVYGNHAHDNTGGILVFNLPGLAVKDGKRAYVHDNIITNNNRENFATEGNMVADVPRGTGLFILASDDNEISANQVTQHMSTGISVISWYLTLRDDEGKMDPDYDWFPERNYVHDNELSNNGADPQDNALTIAAIASEETLPDLVWDGIFDTDKLGAEQTADAVPPESLRNCFDDNGEATFINLDVEHNGASKSTDVTPYACTRDGLPAIEL